MKVAAFATAAAVIAAAAHSIPAGAAQSNSASAAAAKTVKAANFTLMGVDGVKHKLSDYRGRPVAIYFFCGCKWCHAAGGLWSNIEKANAIPKTPSGKPAVTLIVFQGDAAAAKQFASETSLDLSQNVFLTDENYNVTTTVYNAEPCPRVFVVDPAGNVAYTNNHKDDQPRKAPEMTIVNRALTALTKAAQSGA